MPASDFTNFYELTLRDDPHPVVWQGIGESYGSMERTSFINVPKKPLFDRYTYQAAIQQNSMPGSVWDEMKKAGLGPTRANDLRTGIIIFDGNRIIGSLADPGRINPPTYVLFVDPAYRDKDIGQWLIMSWWKEFPRHRTLQPRQVYSQTVAATAMAAWPKFLQLCQSEGKPVPQRVLDAVSDDQKWMQDKIEAAKVAYTQRTGLPAE